LRSIRHDLTVGLVSGILALTAAAGGASFWLIQHLLTAQFDSALLVHLSAIAAATLWEEGKVEVDVAAASMPEFRAKLEPWFFEVADAQRHEVSFARSESLRGRVWQIEGKAAEAPEVYRGMLPDGRVGRIAIMRMTPTADVMDWDDPEDHEAVAPPGGGASEEAPEVVIAVACGDDQLRRERARIGAILLCMGVCISGGSVVLVRRTLGTGLRPLEDLTTRVQEIDAETLHTRVEVHEATPAEILPIAERINELLARLEGAFARERRFTAAAAHELRTPIAELRTMFEVCRSRARSEAEYVRMTDEAHAVIIHLQRLVDALFAIGRQACAPGGGVETELSDVELGAVLQEACAKADRRAKARGGAVLLNGSDCRAIVHGDRDLVAAILENMLGNAVEHADGTPVVRVSIESGADGWTRVSVRNAIGPEVAGDVARVFEPFWRADKARTAQGHLGLGLTVAQSFAKMMGGAMDASAEEGGRGICVRLWLRCAGGWVGSAGEFGFHHQPIS